MRRGSTGLALVLALAAGFHPARAGDDWMSEEGMRAAFADKTVQGHYGSGKSFTETYKAGGAISYQEREAAFIGHWSLQAGTFCTIYDTTPTGGCYQVRQVSDNCYEFYFVARTEMEAAVDGPGKPSWTARIAVSDRDATCSEKPTV